MNIIGFTTLSATLGAIPCATLTHIINISISRNNYAQLPPLVVALCCASASTILATSFIAFTADYLKESKEPIVLNSKTLSNYALLSLCSFAGGVASSLLITECYRLHQICIALKYAANEASFTASESPG